MDKRKNKKLIGVIGLIAIMLIGATLAYFNQTLTAENPFDTGKYDSVLTEDFNPGDGENWEPNATVNKKIAVDNTGDYPIVVRAKFEDLWTNKDSGDAIFKSSIGRDGTTGQLKDDDGLTKGDTSVVELIFNGDKGVAENWTYNKDDGYWYYNETIPAGKSTGDFLTAVKLIENTDMGTYEIKKYYTNADTKPAKDNIGSDPEKQWVEYTTAEVPDGSKHNMTVTNQLNPGYSNANYVLKITAETVQATTDAVKDAFNGHTLSTWKLK